MKKNKKQQIALKTLIKEIDKIIARCKAMEKRYKKQLSKVHPRFALSARNLIHYRALRTLDLTSLQKELGNMGLSRLSHAEHHVMASLKGTKNILESYSGKSNSPVIETALSFNKSQQLEKYNAKSLLGYRSKGRNTRIMVTIPTIGAYDYDLIYKMIKKGMNCARINCAHDDAKVWAKMVENIKKASAKLNRKCKIAMDLGGPKIRTGALKPGPKIRKFRPQKDIVGNVVAPCKIWISETDSTDPALLHLPVRGNNWKTLKKGDRLFFRDTRKKKRELLISETSKTGCEAELRKTCFLETGMPIFSDPKRTKKLLTVGELPAIAVPLLLKTGDQLRLHRNLELGENAQKGKPAHLSCTLPQLFEEARKGEPIFFDDGKIEGVFQKLNKNEALVEIVHAAPNGSKLRADKGINLPSTNLSISGLTKKDRKDLEFVVRHADVINFSFVNRPQDVKDLLKAMKALKAPEKSGIILKIETQNGFDQLTESLLEAMQNYPVGVMIARGDLAIEVGWKNIGRVQREIMALCSAANIPVVWATQVLENLSKQGVPSRAEITDTVMAQRADAVMLNKGPYILNSIELLDTILKRLAPYQDKNERLLPRLEKANGKSD